MRDLDIIFIAGDLFDRLMEIMNSDVHEAMIFLGKLMRFCETYQIKLRILEGTPSHDRRQSLMSRTIFEILQPACDFKYIETLCIEKIEDLGISVLYVPDEWRADPTVTYKEVVALLKQNNLTKVQISIMHGMFRYQAPVGINIPCHIEEDYLNITEWFINIGHHHTHTHFDRIIAEGSFDRLAHGEEEPKGAIVCEVTPNEKRFTFMENKDALIFKTIELKSKNLDKSISQIEKVIGKIPEDSMIRIKCAKDHPVSLGFDELKIRFPMYNFTKMNIDDTDEPHVVSQTLSVSRDYVPITIGRNNIVDLIMNEVKAKHSLQDEQHSVLVDALEKLHV